MKVFSIPSRVLRSWMVKGLLYGLKTIGLAPLSIEFRTQTRSSRNTFIKVFLPSKIGLIYNFVLAILIQVTSVLGISSIISMEYPDKTYLNQALDVMEHILHVSTTSFIIVHLALRQKKAAIIMNRLLDVHFLLPGARDQLCNQKTYIFLSLQMVFHVFLWATTLSTEVFSNQPLSLIATYSTYLIIYFFCIEYSIILGVVVRQLEILNQNLSNLNDFPSYLFRTTLPCEHLAILSSPSRSQLATLKLLHSIRTTLFELSQDIADLFSLPILLSIACTFCSLVEAFHFLVVLISDRSNDVSMMMHINDVTWILLNILPLMLLASKVTETIKKAYLTGRIVHTLLATSKKREIVSELEQFSLHLVHEDVSFTAYGFFTLDFTLLQSMFGATVTYLVIMYQFTHPDNDQHRSNGTLDSTLQM